MRQQSVKLVELRLRRVVVRVSSGTLDLINDWVEGAIGMLWGAEVTQAPVRFTCELLQKPRYKARFTYTRFAQKEHDLTFAAFRPRPAAREQIEFFFPAYKVSQIACAERFEATFDRLWPQSRPCPCEARDALEVL